MLPRVEPQRASQVQQPHDDSKRGDLLVNNLVYKQPQALSLAKSRTQVKQFFQQADYTSAQSKTAICDWNTGSSYIDVGNSYLCFDILAKNTAGNSQFSFGIGSVMNAIDRITIRSRSGTELERLEGANIWSRIDSDYSMSSNCKETMGSLMGVGGEPQIFDQQGEPSPRLVYTTTASDGSFSSPVTLLIPLKRLCPFFRPLKAQLLPPQLASGLHIEIVFEKTASVFLQPDADTDLITTYDVNDIHFLLDTVDLSDETQKTINMESADNGLEWVTPRVYFAKTSMPSGQNQVSVQVRKACSQATMAYSILQNTNELNDLKKDSMMSRVNVWKTTWQYRIGSLFFPQQPVDVESLTSTGAKSYYEALYAFDKPKHPYHSGSVSIRSFNQGKSIYAMSASKNDDLFLSGLPINNSRVLEFNLEIAEPAGGESDRVLTTFLEYIQVVKSYVDNTAVAI